MWFFYSAIMFGLGHLRRRRRAVGDVRGSPKPDVASTNESFVDRGR
jgi:hypothetical protein